MKAAFITGITGQDGSYLTELLLEKGYKLEKTELKEEDWFVVELEYQRRQERNSKGQLCFEFPIIVRTRIDKPLNECEA